MYLRCSNCGYKQYYGHSEFCPNRCGKTMVRVYQEEERPNPSPRYTSAPGVDTAGLGHTYTAEDRDWYQKQHQDAKDRNSIWREGRWDD
jgi:hypothetical protein